MHNFFTLYACRKRDRVEKLRLKIFSHSVYTLWLNGSYLKYLKNIYNIIKMSVEINKSFFLINSILRTKIIKNNKKNKSLISI